LPVSGLPTNWLEFENGPAIVIHAMALRRAFYSLLPTEEDG
jgi:hypothetical protein